MKKIFLTLIVVSVLMLGLQSFKAPSPVHHFLNKVTNPWLNGYSGRILYDSRTIYMNASYPGTITDMVIENSDGSLTTVVSWTSPTTVDTILGGFRYTGRIYYLTPSNEVAFIALSNHIETQLD